MAAGYSSNGSNYDFALVRYNTNGSLDTTFGTGGIVTTPIGSGNAIANALGIQSDGNIVATGSSYNGTVTASPALSAIILSFWCAASAHRSWAVSAWIKL